MAEIRKRINESLESRTSESEQSLEERMHKIRHRRDHIMMPSTKTPSTNMPCTKTPNQVRTSAHSFADSSDVSVSADTSMESRPRLIRTRTIEHIPSGIPLGMPSGTPSGTPVKDTVERRIPVSIPIRDPVKQKIITNIPLDSPAERFNESASESGEAKQRRPKQLRTSPREIPLPVSPANNSIATAKYTDEAIKQLLAGYILVSPTLYDYIPLGAHIRYFRRDRKANSRNDTFKLGGFVQRHYKNNDKSMLMLETVPGSCVSCGHEPAYKLNNHVTYPLAYDEIDELWKKYDAGAFIEIHLIYGSLQRKEKKIAELEARILALEKR